MTKEQIQAALDSMPDGSDINDIDEWAHKYKQVIRDAIKAALQEGEKK